MKREETLISSIKRLNDSGHSVIISTHDPIIQNIQDKDSEILFDNGITIERTNHSTQITLRLNPHRFLVKNQC